MDRCCSRVSRRRQSAPPGTPGSGSGHGDPVLAFTYGKLCSTYLWEIVLPTYGKLETVLKLLRTLTKVFSDANLFSNLVTIDLLSELYLMVPLVRLVKK